MKTFLLTLLALSFNSYADLDCGNARTPMEIMICSQYFHPDELGQGPTSCEKNDEAKLILARTGGRTRTLPGLSRGHFAEGADCTGFIRNNGSLGPLGNAVKEYIANSSERRRFLEPNYIKEACPGWDGMNEAEKEHFWVWTVASIAWDESRCVSRRRNTRASDGVGVGLLQLNEEYSKRSYRGPNCRVNSVRDDIPNIKCGLDTMAELLKGRDGIHKGYGAIFRENNRNTSYWEKLKRPGGGTIGKLIKSYPLCNGPSI